MDRFKVLDCLSTTVGHSTVQEYVTRFIFSASILRNSSCTAFHKLRIVLGRRFRSACLFKPPKVQGTYVGSFNRNFFFFDPIEAHLFRFEPKIFRR